MPLIFQAATQPLSNSPIGDYHLNAHGKEHLIQVPGFRLSMPKAAVCIGTNTTRSRVGAQQHGILSLPCRHPFVEDLLFDLHRSQAVLPWGEDLCPGPRRTGRCGLLPWYSRTVRRIESTEAPDNRSARSLRPITWPGLSRPTITSVILRRKMRLGHDIKLSARSTAWGFSPHLRVWATGTPVATSCLRVIQYSSAGHSDLSLNPSFVFCLLHIPSTSLPVAFNFTNSCTRFVPCKELSDQA